MVEFKIINSIGLIFGIIGVVFNILMGTTKT